MDTFYNNISRPYIQTFIFQETSFMIDILHETLISLSMSEDLDIHEKKLATDKYEDLFDVVLTDRSFEFNKSNLF